MKKIPNSKIRLCRSDTPLYCSCGEIKDLLANENYVQRMFSNDAYCLQVNKIQCYQINLNKVYVRNLK